MALSYGVVGQVVRGGSPPSNNSVGVLGQTAAGAAVRGEVTSAASNTGTGVVGVAANCEFGNASSVGVGGSGRGAGSSATGKTGVLGITDFGVGVQGWAMAGGIGIRGASNGGGGPDFGGSGIGVEGRSGSGVGVRGLVTGGQGVYGSSTAGVGTIGTSSQAAGMYGFSSNGVGVFGTSPTNVGVFGQANQNAGVFGDSPVNGVWGRTTTGLGIKGEATGAGIGVYGRAGANGWAGYFLGNVFVTGTLIQGGGAIPQAASAPTATMTEDVGTARLVNGAATVTLAEEIIAAIGGQPYQVFVTEVGDAGGLFVAGQGPQSFEVRSRKPGTDVAFHYRVVARSKQPARRAAGNEAAPSVTVPRDVPAPTAPELPKIEEPKIEEPRIEEPTREARSGDDETR